MPTQDARTLAALQLLLRSSHLSAPDRLPGLVEAAGGLLGGAKTTLWLVDYDQVELVPMSSDGDGRPVPVEGTLAGRCFSDLVQHTSTIGAMQVLWTPVLDGTDRLGVLQLQLPEGGEADEEMREAVTDVASLIAELVVTRSLYGDAVEKTRRRTPLTVPAEVQWNLLPPLTFVSPQVAVAGVLAPAAEVAGDSFDYAIDGDTLHVAIFDAMGHGLQATLLASIAVGTLRNSRRSALDLPTTVLAIDDALQSHFGGDAFVTGIIGQLHVPTGWWRWAPCGHPPAMVVRGTRVVRELDALVGPPLGLGMQSDPPPIGQERLESGDRLLLYTDGVVEARDAHGAFFGVDRLVDLVGRQAAGGRAVAETLRRLNLEVLRHQGGNLQDDATTVVVEWLTDEAARSTP